MFGKGKPPPRVDLAERVRQVAGKPATASQSCAITSRTKRAERQAVFRQAMIVFDSGAKMQAALKSVSETGARIEFFSNAELPLEFIIVEPTLRLKTRVRVVWQRGGVAGLAFIR